MFNDSVMMLLCCRATHALFLDVTDEVADVVMKLPPTGTHVHPRITFGLRQHRPMVVLFSMSNSLKMQVVQAQDLGRISAQGSRPWPDKCGSLQRIGRIRACTTIEGANESLPGMFCNVCRPLPVSCWIDRGNALLEQNRLSGSHT